MRTYKVKIRFLTKYLQARFSEDQKKELENYVSKGIVKSKEDSWKTFLYFDDNGIYIPSIHLRKAIVNAGKEFKAKKKRSNLKVWAQSNILIEPERIYVGKNEPDEIVLSYPARKDGNRVVNKHPAIKEGTEVDFILKIMFDEKEVEDEAIEELVKTAGEMYGIGARRSDLFGRFEIVEFKKIKS
jgi:hypothetical protein